MCVENSSKKTKHLSVIFQRVRNHGVMMIKYYFWIWQAAQLFDGKKKILAKPKAMSSLCLLSQQKREPGPNILLWSRNLPGTQTLWLPQNEPTGTSNLHVDSMSPWLPWGAPEANIYLQEGYRSVLPKSEPQALPAIPERDPDFFLWLPSSKWFGDIIYPPAPAP